MITADSSIRPSMRITPITPRRRRLRTSGSLTRFRNEWRARLRFIETEGILFSRDWLFFTSFRLERQEEDGQGFLALPIMLFKKCWNSLADFFAIIGDDSLSGLLWGVAAEAGTALTFQ